MQPPNTFVDLPQFTDVATFALRLVKAYTSWQAPGTSEDVFAYFARTPRNTGDEHGLRATLIRSYRYSTMNLSKSNMRVKNGLTLCYEANRDIRVESQLSKPKVLRFVTSRLFDADKRHLSSNWNAIFRKQDSILVCLQMETNGICLILQ